jgi:hypothetical protein
VSMTTPQGGNNRESGVVRITRKAVAGAGKAPTGDGPDDPGAGDSAGSEAMADDQQRRGTADANRSGALGARSAAKSVPAKASGARSSGGKSSGSKPAGAVSAGGRAAGAKSPGGRSAGAEKSAGAAKSAGTAKSAGAAKNAASGRKPGGPGTSRPSGGAGRRPPVVVAKQRNWTAISLVSAAILAFVVIVGYAVYAIHQNGLTFQQKADKINGVVDYRKTDPTMLTRNHVYGVVNYKVIPPVGGDHNPNWQRCAADVYTAPIANENAVHALEHGSVWVTYRPDLPAAQVAQLAADVKKYSDFMLMSPYPGLSAPISLQAWGFQLKVDNASDGRITKFIQDLRVNAAVEPGVTCTTGNYVTATGTQPHNLGPVPAATPPSPAPSATQ